MDSRELMTLSELNEILETTEDPDSGLFPGSLWIQWLWQCDPQERVTVMCPLNRHHLLGLIIARLRSKFQPIPESMTLHNVLSDELLVIVDTPVTKMTFRELQDSLDNLQVCWKQHSSQCVRLKQAVELLFCRFGDMVSKGQPESVLDDQSAWDVFNDEGDDLRTMSIPTIRKFLDLFLVLFRMIYLQRNCRDASVSYNDIHLSRKLEIKRHHISASLDTFYSISMQYDLMPGARLQYMHEFSGMYNSVTQVVYFHQPDYQRRMQLELDDILSGDHAINTLPCVMQLYPIPDLYYEDSNFATFTPGKKGDGKWHWLVVSGLVFLIDDKGVILHSSNVRSLANIYIHCGFNKTHNI